MSLSDAAEALCICSAGHQFLPCTIQHAAGCVSRLLVCRTSSKAHALASNFGSLCYFLHCCTCCRSAELHMHWLLKLLVELLVAVLLGTCDAGLACAEPPVECAVQCGTCSRGRCQASAASVLVCCMYRFAHKRLQCICIALGEGHMYMPHTGHIHASYTACPTGTF